MASDPRQFQETCRVDLASIKNGRLLEASICRKQGAAGRPLSEEVSVDDCAIKYHV